jgi:hypothetical protein
MPIIPGAVLSQEHESFYDKNVLFIEVELLLQ